MGGVAGDTHPAIAEDELVVDELTVTHDECGGEVTIRTSRSGSRLQQTCENCGWLGRPVMPYREDTIINPRD